MKLASLVVLTFLAFFTLPVQVTSYQYGSWRLSSWSGWCTHEGIGRHPIQPTALYAMQDNHCRCHGYIVRENFFSWSWLRFYSLQCFPVQTDSNYKWCVEEDGDLIAHTLVKKIYQFPYDCYRTRKCPKGTVREFTRRCEATCEEAVAEGYGTKFHCWWSECICPRGQYRSKNGNCVRLDKCPKQICKSPMVFTNCATKCPPTCATPQPSCDHWCAEGIHCVCPEGMMFITHKNQTCVKEKDCPKCGHGSIVGDCTPSWGLTCSDKVFSDSCRKSDHCMCPEGTIRLDRKLLVRCVPKYHCPHSYREWTQWSKCSTTCGRGETTRTRTCMSALGFKASYTDACDDIDRVGSRQSRDCLHKPCITCDPPRVPKGCGTACPPTCDDPHPECTDQCVSDNICSCPNGYVQRSTMNKTCIALADCQKERLECKAPAKPEICNSTCPATCEGNERPACFRKCNSDSQYVCGCTDGYVRKSRNNDTCIRPDDCPPLCEFPKIYMECASICQPTCQIPTKPPSCKRGCSTQMCVCPTGMVQLSKEAQICVDPSECPICEAPGKLAICTTTCPATCDGIDVSCARQCNSEYVCTCPDGYVQKSINDTDCVKLEDCSVLSEECATPKVFEICPSKCQPTCRNPQPDVENCETGCREDVCICRNGTVLLNEELDECVEMSQCPTTCEPPRVPKQCGAACPPTCDDPEPACGDECVPENICSCPDGYVQRNAVDKTCVALADCQKERLECKAPAKPEICTSTCPATCEGSKGPACLRRCRSDSEYVCGCPDGYVQRSRENETCIRPAECASRCEFPKIYMECASLCQPTCQAPEKPASCKRGCSTQLCVCPVGMVQLSKETLICLDPAECPVCEAPGKPAKCTTTCPATCEGIDLSCVRRCDSKYVCSCPDGYIHRSMNDTTCVEQEKCSVPSEECTAPKVFEKCPPKCQPTCQNPKPDLENCETGCREDVCVCQNGTVRLNEESNECVELSQCPNCSSPATPVKCTNICPESCEPRRLLCLRNCQSMYVCGCTGDYVLNARDGKECVKQKECPAPCEQPKIYANCASMCQPTCQVPNPGSCKRGCNSRKCFCPAGMVQPAEDDFSCINFSDCPKNCTAPKVYKECPSKCQPTCENQKPDLDECDLGCREDVCVCPEGMILMNGTSDKCVTPFECPTLCEFPEVRANCRTNCSVRCDTLATLVAQDCAVECGKDFCACADGHLPRSKTDPTCVPVASCLTLPVLSNPKKSPCEEPKIYKECVSKCRPTCQTPNPVFCDESCESDLRCVCPPGMVHPKNGNNSCVLLSECSKQCNFPSIATNCAPICLATCDDPVPKCNKGCNPDVKCICPNGLLRVNSTDSSCVLPTQCPGLSQQNCPLRKIPTACASGCPATCENQNPRFCTKPCRPDVKCECVSGMVQRSMEDDTCLWPQQCDTSPIPKFSLF